ncbi:sigma-54 interaction domain-containing protein [Alicyclobacillus pomorum]|uniref:sigma-54 interaction domain-containing protein n=1 Tax=Alicyclobacillus pomorum TaxID=204470 RepID=UPI000409CC4C|nr:sigma 54-interacting transcriptional regulator [Alicyclobacillus pomorum]
METTKILEVLNALDTPLLLVEQGGRIEWANQAAKVTVCTHFEFDSWTGEHALPEGYSYILHKDVLGPNLILIECLPLPEGPDVNNMWTLQQENNELEELINSSLDEWYITDGEGVTLRVNEKVEQLYGPLVGGLVGKSVFDLERQGIFYPSVTAMVLRHHKQQTVLQNTIDGRRLISTGNPIFHADGSIKRVISYAKDVSELELLTLNVRSHSAQAGTSLVRPVPFVSNSPAMRRCMDVALRVARTDACVLLLGETGVGKNRVARYIHEMSRRANGPWVEINCASIPETLLESELFGYERGSFTGARREGKPGKVELAHGGTLFLNEIGDLPLHLQGKMLDLLQEHRVERIGSTKSIHVDIRIIAATNRNLREMVEQGRFRADLFYRLNVVPIEIPPLRDRLEDIRPLSDVYLEQFAVKHHLVRPEFDEECIRLFLEYSWPGNIREFENMVERLVITVDERVIQPHHLPPEVLACGQKRRGYPSEAVLDDGTECKTDSAGAQVPMQSESWRDYKLNLEREIYKAVLEKCSSTREIAKILGVSQSTVVRKLKQYGLR